MRLNVTLRVLFFILLSHSVFGQSANYPIWTWPVVSAGDTLEHPWTGGYDRPQFSRVDLNSDSALDWAVYDAAGGAWRIFLADDGAYVHQPNWQFELPQAQNFARLLDYNADGQVDVFIWSGSGMTVYRGRDESNFFAFDVVASPLQFETGFGESEIYLRPGDVPAIEDFDGDGDLDIAAFGVLGTSLPYFQNMSVERGFGLDSLVFERTEPCWGDFSENTLNNGIELDIMCSGRPYSAPRPKHAGSTTTAFDADDDGDMDMLIGDVTFSNLTFLNNGGNEVDAHITAYDSLWPSPSQRVNLPFFPSAYWVDADDDGVKDILVTPTAGDDYANVENVWFYKKSASGFTRQSKSFWVDQSLDFGSNSFPLWYDVNKDGLIDLLVANDYTFDSTRADSAQIAYLQNVGTATAPSFELQDQNIWNLRSLGLRRLRMAFGDVDADGDDDMVVGHTNGTLIYFENEAGPSAIPSFAPAQSNWFSIDVGSNSHPALYDANSDGLLDLIVGRQFLGRMSYFPNQGSGTAASFNAMPANDFFGEIATDSQFVNAAASPFIYTTPSGEIYIYSGSFLQGLTAHEINEDSLLAGRFKYAIRNVTSVRPSIFTTISLADVNEDGALDFAVGGAEGGVQLFSETMIDTPLVNSIGKDRYAYKPLVYPNPHEGKVTLTLQKSEEGWYTVVNALGQVLVEGPWSGISQTLSLPQATRNELSYVLLQLHSGTLLSAPLIGK